jgi:RNA-binding protein YlmH
MKSFAILGLALFARAHQVDEDVPDDVLLRGTEEIFDKSDLNIEKDIKKYNLSHKFSDQFKAAQRGEVIITRNKATQEILKVELDESVAPP